MRIREATSPDWAGIWPFLRRIIAAGDTYTWAPDTPEERARALWFKGDPWRAFVATDSGDTVVGSAITGPNQLGPGGHVATASFMVHPDHGGGGIGRALGEHVLSVARADGYRAMQFNAVVETNIGAVNLWRSLGFEVVGTVPEAFHHPTRGYVGLHIMHRHL
ncbi:GNAT family N-acetyltransferase [Halostreptopolyspora alba]|uniref:GNAT family N-acetyltransferase n=1 Tax=Halostreptopolyspora alba TaxID=2487137 RepID=A0A3N0E3W5_9ACTN|nr:GNAT family N-acetyltransferase [Nocardiopsaceae bacterium YIM 96095]